MPTRTFIARLSAALLSCSLAGLAPAQPATQTPPASGKPASATPEPTSQPKPDPKPDAPKSEKPTPGPKSETATLKVGDKLPELTFKNEKGEDVSITKMYATQPIVLTMYRGGWCPYCNTSLKQWQEKLETVSEMGAKIVAVSPEKTALIAETVKKDDLTYTILSDSTGAGAKALGLNFAVDPATQKKYKGFGVDLAQRNGDGEWNLPHPATMVIDTTGTIRYISMNEDYKKRPKPEEVIEAIKKIAPKKTK